MTVKTIKKLPAFALVFAMAAGSVATAYAADPVGRNVNILRKRKHGSKGIQLEQMTARLRK